MISVQIETSGYTKTFSTKSAAEEFFGTEVWEAIVEGIHSEYSLYEEL
tara:strand:+ start:335 stop:478 length:144 start_codon:yes stop_codon:yes gene_type:complete